MKIFKKVNLYLSFCLIFSVVIGNVSLPVFAYSKDGVSFEQNKSRIAPNSDRTIVNKINSPSREVKNFFIDSEEKFGLRKPQQAELSRKDYVEGEILVKYKSDKIDLDTFFGHASALNFTNSRSLERKEDLRKNNISVLRIKDSRTVEEKIAELKSDPNVEYAQPNFQYHPAAIETNDTDKDLLWGLYNTGQPVNGVSGVDDADIDAPEAWAINEGTTGEVIVAVIDTGVAYNHPDLADNMWDGVNCLKEDGFALGNCNHGYDFEDDDKTPLPTTSSHGTHIAGTIVAVKDNSIGIVGVAPSAKIMALKSSLTTADNVKSINFAQQNGAKIINASWGGSNSDQLLKDAIASFPGLFVVASGNESTDNDTGTHLYPSDFDLDNIVSVAATDQNDALADFSNYGATSVDVGAPGVNIYSTIPGEVSSDVLNETFESVIDPDIPVNWTKEGSPNYWGTFDFSGDKVLYGDYLNIPYANNVNSTVSLPAYDLSGSAHANIDFLTRCDTEYTADSWYDYMALEISSGDGVFFELIKWDETLLDILNGESPLDSSGGSVYYFEDLEIPSEYLTSNFKLRFRWVTDASNVPDIDYDGCWIDDVKITKTSFSDGSDEQYDYKQGTSMAAPHVAGLAGLIWGYNPELSYIEVKDAILENGDPLDSLAGKTVSGKRINAFNALNSLMSETHAISGTVKYYDGVKTVPGATVILEDGLGAQIATTTTDIGGSYQFTDVASGGDYVVRIDKDDTASGLSSADQIKIGRHKVGLEPFDTIYKIIAGDVNDSGSLTSGDQIKIGRFKVGLDASLTSGVWKFFSSDAVLDAINYLTTGLSRVYANLAADAPDQDFVGVKMGDVNNSWTSN